MEISSSFGINAVILVVIYFAIKNPMFVFLWEKCIAHMHEFFKLSYFYFCRDFWITLYNKWNKPWLHAHFAPPGEGS